jgi:hypothetical protein
LLQENHAINDFMVPPYQAQHEIDDEDSAKEPMSPQIGGTLKNLEDYLIKGDLRRCVICNEKFRNSNEQGDKGNLPRVLYCGDCLCEQCIIK